MKPSLVLHHRIKASLALFGHFASGHQDAIRLRRSAPNAPAQLVKLRQTETLGMLDHHHGRIGHIHAYLDHRGRHQNLQLAFLKHPHDLVFQVGIEAAVQQPDFQIRENTCR